MNFELSRSIRTHWSKPLERLTGPQAQGSLTALADGDKAGITRQYNIELYNFVNYKRLLCCGF
jgi:hypothetical protein